MDKQHLLETLKHNEADIISENFDYNLEITSQNTKFQKLGIIQTTFQRAVKLSGLSNFESISISDCDFQNQLTLENFTLQNGQQQTILFDNCNFKRIRIDKCISKSLTLIFNNCTIKSLSCSRSELYQLEIDSGTIEFAQFSDTYFSKLYMSDFSAVMIRIEKHRSDQIIISKIIPQNPEKLSILMLGITAGTMEVSECVIDHYLTIIPNSIEELSILSSKGDGHCYIEWEKHSFIRELNMNYFGLGAGTLFSGIKADPDDTFHINDFTIYMDPGYQGNIEISQMNIRSLEITGTNTKSTIQISKTKSSQISLNTLLNSGELYLSDVRALSLSGETTTFQVVDSKLGKAHFFNVDLNSFDQFNYHDSDLTEIGISHVNWFNGKTLSMSLLDKKPVTPEDREALRDGYKRQRDLFRQLKLVMEKAGDKANALEFFQWEMWNYKKVVQIRGSFANRFILLIGQTNDFGTNWVKPLLILLVASFICYIPIAAIIDNTICVCNPTPLLTKHLYLWFNLMNPTHTLDKFLPETLKQNTWIYFFDLLDRIVVSLFIYQIIIAFRKYFRNS